LTRLFFDGRPIETRAGDTVASALYRAGRRIFSRSFKYHRPRGLLCVAGRCPNCLVTVDGQPSVRACVTPIRDGMQVRHQNATPSLEFDWLSAGKWFSRLMPVGFYYKTFTHPRAWKLARQFIRRAAGLGEVSHVATAVPDRYEHMHNRADVAVIGGGPAGMRAAIGAAEGGQRVVLVDDQPELGGHLRYQRLAGVEQARGLQERVEALENVEVLRNASCFGLYEGTLLGIVQRPPVSGAATNAAGDAAGGSHRSAVEERLIHLRAERIVIATGAYEVPRLFTNNDLPGVMLSSGVERLLHVHGVKVAERAVVISDDPDGGPMVEDLRAAGVEVVAVVTSPGVRAATGGSQVTGLTTTVGHFACDLVVVCGDWMPDAGLVGQAGGRLEWDEPRGAFVPAALPPHVTAVGAVAGVPDQVAGAARREPAQAPGATTSPSPQSFVCLCEDVTAKDVKQAIAEGFDHIETFKRYTTVTMGPCQGRMCQLAAIGICARETNRSMVATGMTTARPPTLPVSLGALAGARHHPTKRTPMHERHEALGCTWMDMGEWKRPLHYGKSDSADGPGGREAKARAVEGEYRAVRERVGMIDLSTLGKLQVTGTDAAKLLDKVYTNRLGDLRPGRSRYSVICDDAGIILDDGTISRLADDHFFVTTTTGNLEFVQQWLEWWAAGTRWSVHVTNVTGGFGAVNVAGPRARELLQPLTDCDLGTRAFPYMACRRAEVAGVPCRLLRIGFVGETGWEIHFPAEYGEYLWDLLLQAGQDFGIRPFGVETQRVLRLEKKHVIAGVDTDATSNPVAANLAWVAKLDKEDFIGKAAILEALSRTPRERLVSFRMTDGQVPEDGAAIVEDGQPVGRVTSARFSFANGKAIGLAWVPAALAADGQEIQVNVDGQLAGAHLVAEAFYDPEGTRLRS